MNKSYLMIVVCVALSVLISAFVTSFYLSSKYRNEKLTLEGRITQLEANQQADEEPPLPGCSNLGGKGFPESDPKALGTAVYSKIEKATKGEWDKLMTLQCFNDTYTAAQGKYSTGYDQWGWLAWRENTSSAWKVLVSLDGFDCNEYNQVPEQILTDLQLDKLTCYNHSS